MLRTIAHSRGFRRPITRSHSHVISVWRTWPIFQPILQELSSEDYLIQRPKSFLNWIIQQELRMENVSVGDPFRSNTSAKQKENDEEIRSEKRKPPEAKIGNETSEESWNQKSSESSDSKSDEPLRRDPNVAPPFKMDSNRSAGNLDQPSTTQKSSEKSSKDSNSYEPKEMDPNVSKDSKYSDEPPQREPNVAPTFKTSEMDSNLSTGNFDPSPTPNQSSSLDRSDGHSPNVPTDSETNETTRAQETADRSWRKHIKPSKDSVKDSIDSLKEKVDEARITKDQETGFVFDASSGSTSQRASTDSFTTPTPNDSNASQRTSTDSFTSPTAKSSSDQSSNKAPKERTK